MFVEVHSRRWRRGCAEEEQGTENTAVSTSVLAHLFAERRGRGEAGHRVHRRKRAVLEAAEPLEPLEVVRVGVVCLAGVVDDVWPRASGNASHDLNERRSDGDALGAVQRHFGDAVTVPEARNGPYATAG